MEVEVTFEYEAEQDDELTIKVGDIIKNVTTSEGGWWEGELNGKVGMFPDNFVKAIEKEKEEPAKLDAGKNSRRTVKELANKIKENVHVGSAPTKKETSVKRKKAKVLFEYIPENEDEIKIEVGDVVEVVKQEEEGWWEGMINGKTGMFPSNFVAEIDDEEAEKLEKEKAKVEEKAKEVPQSDAKKKVMGVGLGNIFEGGPIKLRTTGGLKKEQEKEQKVAEEAPAVVRREKPANKPERAIVRYSYDADNDDELTLKDGQIITILDKNLEDAGWWKGEYNGTVGVFPDNFVELLPPEEPRPKKPPPPSTTKQPPKIPDQGPVHDSSARHKALAERQLPPEPSHAENKSIKKKDHTDAAVEKRAPPPIISSKKPSMPPPIGAKPGPKPTSSLEKTSPSSQKEEHKTSSLPKDEKKDRGKDSLEDNFDAVETTTDKLTHLTASRAKGPSKRPPSQVILTNEDEKPNLNGDVKELHKRPPPLKEEAPPKSHNPPSRPPEPSPGTANLLLAVEELKREMRELKMNTVSKAAYQELRAENDKLKQDIENIKRKQSQQYQSLFTEIDEEKKIRLTTQVEMERIRKLVTESHV